MPYDRLKKCVLAMHVCGCSAGVEDDDYSFLPTLGGADWAQRRKEHHSPRGPSLFSFVISSPSKKTSKTKCRFAVSNTQPRDFSNPRE
jgi:hypothetical protein